MTATGHAVIGTVIAAKIGNPYLAIPLALLSHIAADAFPHWDTATNRKKKSKAKLLSDTFLDVALSLTVPIFLGPFLNPSINFVYTYIIVFFAQFFDWISAPYPLLNIRFAPIRLMYNFQLRFDNRLDKPWGIIGQAAVLIMLIVFAKII
ncbi:MAG: hypothetical protein Q8Q49_04635 [bacterium]|nr:hypothetical protein [bacterium]